MATRPGDDENGSRLWRGMRALLFGDDQESTLRDQIEEAIDEAETGKTKAKRGDLSPPERQMLRNLLHFGDRTAGEICVPRGDIVSIPQSASFDELVAAFADAEHSRLPVTGENLDDIVGMIHIKDVYKALNSDGARVIERLLRAPLFVPESMGMLELLARMRGERVHLAIVVDEFGGTEGLVTIEDVVEEIVGEIEDEHDEDDNVGLVMLSPGIWDVDSRVELEQVRDTVDARLIDEDDEVDTIGGLAFMLAGRLLEPGETVDHPSGWKFECLEADGKRIRRLRLHAPEGSSKD